MSSRCRTTKHKPHLLRVPQAAAYLDNVITVRTLRQWIFAKKIESVRIGGAVCIPVHALDSLIERGKRGGKVAS